ncbi:hypothetical protein [Streptococcus marmotae]
MKIINKFLVIVMLFAITFPVLSSFPTVVFANEEISSLATDEEVEILSSELEFYFNQVGHIDGNGNYQITNPELLLERANSGDIYAQQLYEAYKIRISKRRKRSAADFGMCVLRDYFGVYIDIANGQFWKAFTMDLENALWEKAAGTVLKLLGKSASKANVLATAGQLALAAYNCRSKW